MMYQAERAMQLQALHRQRAQLLIDHCLRQQTPAESDRHQHLDGFEIIGGQ